MSTLPIRCVVDTNVATTANIVNGVASPACVRSSAHALHAVMSSGHIFIDNGSRILTEYRKNLSTSGQPGPGHAFFKWLLTHEWDATRVTHVTITPKTDDPEAFEELPAPPIGIRYDRSDQKFLAVAAAHEDHPPVLQSLDSKWWGWQEALAAAGITIYFLCRDEIEAKHREKVER